MDQLTFIDPAGVQTPLTAVPGALAVGAQGLFMPPVTVIEDELAEQDGARARAVRAMPRDITVPLYMEQGDAATLRAAIRTLLRAVNPKRGDGRLRALAPDGQVREVTCRYTSGLELTQAPGQSGADWQGAAVVFRAHDPYWYDVDPTEETFVLGDSVSFFPFFPLLLSADTVLGARTVSNDGDVPAFPIWTVHGPATAVTLTNVTDGLSLTLDYALDADQVVTIDTRPGFKTVRLDDGSNLYGDLDTGSALWALPDGLTEITVELPGATEESYVALTYRRRWLSP